MGFMKIWFISDTHNQHAQLVVPDVDLVIHCEYTFNILGFSLVLVLESIHSCEYEYHFIEYEYDWPQTPGAIGY